MLISSSLLALLNSKVLLRGHPKDLPKAKTSNGEALPLLKASLPTADIRNNNHDFPHQVVHMVSPALQAQYQGMDLISVDQGVLHLRDGTHLQDMGSPRVHQVALPDKADLADLQATFSNRTSKCHQVAPAHCKRTSALVLTRLQAKYRHHSLQAYPLIRSPPNCRRLLCQVQRTPAPQPFPKIPSQSQPCLPSQRVLRGRVLKGLLAILA